MSESSFLEYLFELHKGQLRKHADYIALLVHAMLLDRKAKLKSGSAILPDDWNLSDPIRLVYQTSESVDINVSVVETNGDVFISATESKEDRLGHLEVPGDDFVNTAAGLPLSQAYSQLDELKRRLEDTVWSVLFPARAPCPAPATVPRGDPLPPSRRVDPLLDPRPLGSYRPFVPDYGRSDLDPFGLGSHPLGSGPGLYGPGGGIGGGGGMFFDPRPRGGHGGRPLFPGAPPEAAPPGARIDPIYPMGGGPGGPRPGRGSRPDPDLPTPPGWEDMYL